MKRKKTGGKDWVPGVSGNPQGRPPVPGDLKKARRVNQVELERVMNKFLLMPPEQFVETLPQAETMLEQIVSSVLEKAAAEGDPRRVDFVLNRLIGKVTDRIEVDSVAVPVSVLISRDGQCSVNGNEISPDNIQLDGRAKPLTITRRDGSKVILGAQVKKTDG